MKIYNKLVRDKIPLIILEDGKQPIFKVAGNEDFNELLKNKLIEEVNEYISADKIDELADILEVIKTIALTNGVSWDEVESIANKKKEERGGFKQKIVLLEVKEV